MLTDEAQKHLHEIVLAGWFYDINVIAKRAGKSLQDIKNFQDILPSDISADSLLNDIFGCNSLTPGTHEACLLAKANMLVNNEQNTISPEVNNNYYEPLVSIISELNIDKREKGELGYISLAALNPKSILSHNYSKCTQAMYENLWNNIKTDFSKLQKLPYEVYIKALDSLCLQYMACVPSSQVQNDISLYQHAKMLSSFASLLFRYYEDKGIKITTTKTNNDEPKFVFIKGDISGIQKYIFDLKSSEDNAKLLRAKSFQLLALSQLLAEHIVKEFEGNCSDIITASGGNFLLVLPLISDYKDKIAKIQNEYELYFLEEFAGRLNMIISNGVEASENTICGIENNKPSIQNLFSKIGLATDIAKQKKMQKALHSHGPILNELYDKLQRNGECAYCNILPAQSDRSDSICENCAVLKDIGEKLIKRETITFLSDKIGKFNTMVKLSNDTTNNAAYIINDYLPGHATIFLPYIAPMCNNEIISFSSIADKSQGNKKLAMFKSDVDNLGLIFSISLGNKMTLARYAEISRLFYYFFSVCYVDFIQSNQKYENQIYTVYSGGDDLCIIGPWDKIMHFANDFHSLFNQFTNNNSSVTLSGGISLANSHLPVRFIAADAEEQLEMSKKYSTSGRTIKNAITIFNTTESWKDYSNSITTGEKFSTYLVNQEMPVATVYKLLDLSDRVKNIRGGKIKDLRNMMWKSNFHYLATKNIKDVNLQKEYLNLGLDDDAMIKSRIAVSYALYSYRSE